MAKGDNTDKRGFASMDPEKQREIARMGGKASHGGGRKSESGNSNRGQGGHRFNSDEAREAGRKGGNR